MIESRWDLLKNYPSMVHPIRCENGCGAVIELTDTYESYERGEDGETKAICECCAAESGHIYEEHEEPEDSPVCRRKPKTRLR